MKALASLSGYLMLAAAPALAQATTPPATGQAFHGSGSSWPSW
jgi:hypothetical protein